MAVFVCDVHETKFLYALIRQGHEAVRRAVDIRDTVLASLFPDVAAQWSDVCRVLRLGISSPVALTGMSMTKADTVPDDTRVPPSVEINAATVRIMYRLAGSLGVTLSAEYEFFDEERNFAQAAATWSAGCRTLLQVEALLREALLYSMAAADVDGGVELVERSPAQMAMFPDCEAPLADGSRWVEAWSPVGIRSAFGPFYDAFMYGPLETMMTTPLPVLLVSRVSVSAEAEDGDPEHPNTITAYPFSVPSGAVIGAIEALAGGVPVRQVVYYAASSGAVKLPVPLADAPETADILLLVVESA